jgi:hypothetical protein
MLYALQTASCNLRNVKFEAEKPTDVVIDPRDVDRTCLNGPQWFAQDFAQQAEKQPDKQKDKQEEKQQDKQQDEQERTVGAVTAGGEKVTAAARPRKIYRGHARPDEARPEKLYPETGRIARAMKINEESTVMHDLVYELFPEQFVREIIAAGPG